MDRPIIFSGPMVRALLDGRKTKTRRLIKPRIGTSLFNGLWADSYVLDPGNASWRQEDVRYEAGDRLWVRESLKRNPDLWVYSADGVEVEWPARRDLAPRRLDYAPSIHMPRIASRLTLAVTDVRVQRLQEISEGDAAAEGIRFDLSRDPFASGPDACWWASAIHERRGWSSATAAFRELWDSLNAKRVQWKSNPWVVALTFTVHQQNIDTLEQEPAS